MHTPDERKGILLEVGTNEVEFLRFLLLDQVFGINVTKIRQVIVHDPAAVVEIPGTPTAIRGQYLFRGDLIPVIDLSLYLKAKIPEATQPRLLLVCEFSLTKVAFLIDAVDRITRCSWENFRPLQNGSLGATTASIVGTVLLQNQLIPIIDVEAILSELIPSSAMHELDVPTTEYAQTTIDRSKIAILFCEDSRIIQKTVMAHLQAAGFSKVNLFSTAFDALTYMQSDECEHIDLIISDIEMPKMDGLTFCKNIRQSAKYKDTPLIFFSSTISDEMQRKCAQVGASASLSKPEILKMVHLIDKLCSET